MPSHRLTQRYDNIENYSDLPKITIEQIEHFFQHYKDLEPDKWVKLADVFEAKVAKKLIREAIERGKK